MVKKALQPQTARHVMIYDDDWQFINDFYSRQGPRPLGASGAIREIVHQKVKTLRAISDSKIDKLEVTSQ